MIRFASSGMALRGLRLVVLLSCLLPATAEAQTAATLAWDPSPDAAGYVVTWGPGATQQIHSVDVGPALSWEVTSLTPGGAYHAKVVAYSASGASSSAAEIQFIAPWPPSLSAPRDFDGDGRTDLIWRHDSEGWLAAWLMNGERLNDSVLLSPGRVDPVWKVEGVADFNGDGRPDLLWRHGTEGWLAVWYMSGTGLLDSVSLLPGRVADPDWRIAAVGDMNGDGRPDIVWQERRHGWIVIWLMDGVRLMQSVDPSVPRVPDTNWRIVGAGDMNRNGRTDLIWQHATAGWLAAWLMDGATVVDSVLLTPTRVTDTDWEIVAVADANGDGHLDLYWRDRRHGWMGLWLMQGLRMVASMALQPDRVADPGWRVVGAR